MKLNSFKIRSSLWGTTALAITSILFCTTLGCGQDKMDTDNLGNPPPIVSEMSTTWTTTSTVTTSSTSTSATSTITTTTTEEITSRIETTVVTTNQTIVAVTNSIEIEEETPTETEPVFEATWIESEPTWTSNTPISDYEYVLLANVVANEYGSNWVSVPEKAKVVATVVNRTNSPLFPNTIEGVLAQPYQFTGYVASGYYQPNVTESCKQAVDYYYEHPDEFGNWLYFWGDGQMNHFG